MATAPNDGPIPVVYRVLTPVNHDQIPYAPGDTISLPDAASAALLAVHAIEATG